MLWIMLVLCSYYAHFTDLPIFKVQLLENFDTKKILFLFVFTFLRYNIEYESKLVFFKTGWSQWSGNPKTWLLLLLLLLLLLSVLLLSLLLLSFPPKHERDTSRSRCCLSPSALAVPVCVWSCVPEAVALLATALNLL